MARLVVKYGSKHEKTVTLDVPELMIGRGDDVGLQVRNQTVSRHHCRIELEGVRHILVDLGSTSGTYLNGNRLDRPTTLQHGDSIELGKHSLVYERDAVETGLPSSAGDDEDEAESTGSDFWEAGLKESGFKGDGSGSSAGADATASDSAPWEASRASEVAMDATSRGAPEAYAGTMLASEDEMKRIRETLSKQQKPHIAAVVKGDRKIVSLEGDSIVVGYFDGADFRLEGSRFFGKKQFEIAPSGRAYMVKVLSMWAHVRLDGERIRTSELLKGGEVIEAGGLKFKFNRGD